MQKALFFLGRYDVDKLSASVSATLVGAGHDRRSDDEFDKDDDNPRDELQAMRDPSAVLAELEGCGGPRHVSSSSPSWACTARAPMTSIQIVDAADGSAKRQAPQRSGLEAAPQFLAQTARGEGDDRLSKAEVVTAKRFENYKYVVVLELADETFSSLTRCHGGIAAADFHANSWDYARSSSGARSPSHEKDRIHADLKPAERGHSSARLRQLIDLDVSSARRTLRRSRHRATVHPKWRAYC